MAQVLVIADDLTGANATGVLLKKNGFDTYTVLDAANGADRSLADCDCLVVPTESRAIDSQEAYERVKAALVSLGGGGSKALRKAHRQHPPGQPGEGDRRLPGCAGA